MHTIHVHVFVGAYMCVNIGVVHFHTVTGYVQMQLRCTYTYWYEVHTYVYAMYHVYSSTCINVYAYASLSLSHSLQAFQMWLRFDEVNPLRLALRVVLEVLCTSRMVRKRM